MRSAALVLVFGSALAVASTGAPLKARAAGPFDYKMETSSEEGGVPPSVDRRFTAAFKQCQDRAQITSQNAACLEAEYRRQDGRLNEVWRATLARLSPEARISLRDAQRKWIRERDPFCLKDADSYSGGTIGPLDYSYCRIELTIRRTIWLEGLR